MSSERAGLRTVEITRDGTRAVADEVADMRHWLQEQHIDAVDLEPVRILRGRLQFRASFRTAMDAERFCREFDLEPALSTA